MKMPGESEEPGTRNSEPRGSAWSGDLVRLRAVREDDWPRFFSFEDDTDGARNGYFEHFPQSEEGVRKWAAEQAAIRQSPDHDNYGFAVEALEPGVGIVGHMNVHGAERRNRHIEYGITLGADYRRKGYGADALRILLRHYFDELGYHRAGGMVYAFNEPSQRFHEAFGFTLEGRVREYHMAGGKLHDILWYGILATEFWAKNPTWRRPA